MAADILLKDILKKSFNLSLITDVLQGPILFTEDQLTQLQALQAKFKENIANLSLTEYNDDPIMLLNHKEALNFVIAHPDYAVPLTVRGIEDIHSLLIKDLGVDRNIRQRRVGISGTNYKPLDNEHQIREALHSMVH